MKRWFTCPDGENIEIDKCLEQCRMKRRCAPRPFLREAAQHRGFDGVHVTMLERCTRQLWLQERVDYAEEPDRSAFRVVGSRAHSQLEGRSTEEESAEKKLEALGLRGTHDLVEEDNGKYYLTDYKVVGSFAVAKMLGITKQGEEDVLDSEGNPVLYQRGPKKGQVKTEPVYVFDEDEADLSQYMLQPNIYRIAWEEANPDKPIEEMRIFAIVRDGGLYIAKSRGVFRSTYMIPIPELEYEYVKSVVDVKRDEILEAMSSEEIPPVGSSKETWNGAFCRSYCPVREACRNNGDNPWLNGGSV